eukprot:Nk52_evm3s164 gene=Nk52_evmTU3s164
MTLGGTWAGKRFEESDIEVGEGSFGKLRLASDRVSGKLVSLKTIDIEEGDESCPLEEKGEQYDFSLLTLANIKTLNSPNLPRVVGHSMGATKFLLALENDSLGSLKDLMTKMSRSFTECEISVILRQILTALGHLHDKNAVHLDIRPQNILFYRDGTIKLSDLGISTRSKSSFTAKRAAKVDIAYHAPEVLKGESFSKKADIWSCGILAMELAQGKLPWSVQGNHIDAVREEITGNTPPSFVDEKEYSKSFLGFVNSCLIKYHMARPSTETLLNHSFLSFNDDKNHLSVLVEVLEDIENSKSSSPNQNCTEVKNIALA